MDIAQRAKAMRELRKRGFVESEPLLDFVPRMTPNYTAPKHLERYAELLENSIGTEIRACVSIPPRHGKTELILHAIAWLLRKNPKITIGYASYSDSIAYSKSRRARELSQAAGVELAKDMANLGEWRTTAGGGVLAGGTRAGWTGHGIDVLFVDDPVKNRLEAESPTVRDAVFNWYTSTAYTRLEPNASVFINMTRWHEDDLVGRMLKSKEEGFEEINFPAVDEETETKPLWPERWTLPRLKKVKAVNEYDWWSLWMGKPRSKDSAVFRNAYYYSELPTSGYRIGIGIDLAYSTSKRADASAMVVVLMVGRDPTTAVFYVLDVIAKRVEAPDFFRDVRMMQQDYPGANTLFRYAGPEKGIVDTMKREGIDVEGRATKGDKFVNAQEIAAVWNDGRWLLPSRSFEDEDEPANEHAKPPDWVKPYLDEHLAFTGVDGKHDDQVDGSISAHLSCVDVLEVVWL